MAEINIPTIIQHGYILEEQPKLNNAKVHVVASGPKRLRGDQTYAIICSLGNHIGKIDIQRQLAFLNELPCYLSVGSLEIEPFPRRSIPC